MSLKKDLIIFISTQVVTWEIPITQKLYEKKMSNLISCGILKYPSEYELARILKKTRVLKPSIKEKVYQVQGNEIYLEFSFDPSLREFYNINGIDMLTLEESKKINSKHKICQAMQILELVPKFAELAALLCNSIHILRQSAKDYDTSYSHPEVPFSVFVSVGNENSSIYPIRLAESILHECMHLKLSLIEENLELVRKDSDETFYSPWREENRPIRGVLHGLFVFRAILDFYTLAKTAFEELPIQLDFIEWRIEQIKIELLLLKGLGKSPGLTPNGAILAKNLLPLS